MRAVFNRCHWQRWEQAVFLVDTYVASRWLWMSPLLHPLQEHMNDMQAFQFTVLAHVLKLYIPEHLSTAQAGGLNRVRRRALLELLRLRSPHSLWVRNWIARKFGYAGHLLRRHVGHLAREELLTPLRQARDGRASTYQRWLLTVCRRSLKTDALSLEQLSNLYLDKCEWMALLPTVHVSHDEQQPARASSGTWGHWRDAVLCSTSWYHAVILWVQEGGYSLLSSGLTKPKGGCSSRSQVQSTRPCGLLCRCCSSCILIFLFYNFCCQRISLLVNWSPYRCRSTE